MTQKKAYGLAKRVTSNIALPAAGIEIPFNQFQSDGEISMPADGQFRLVGRAGGSRYFMFASLKCEFGADDDRVDTQWHLAGGAALTISNLGQIMSVARAVDEQTGVTIAMAVIDVAAGTTTDVELQVDSLAGSGTLEANYTVAIIMEL